MEVRLHKNACVCPERRNALVDSMKIGARGREFRDHRRVNALTNYDRTEGQTAAGWREFKLGLATSVRSAPITECRELAFTHLLRGPLVASLP